MIYVLLKLYIVTLYKSTIIYAYFCNYILEIRFAITCVQNVKNNIVNLIIKFLFCEQQ